MADYFKTPGAGITVLDVKTDSVESRLGATATFKLKLTDNLANALDITEGANSYLKFVSTNASESIVATKPLTASAGVTGNLTGNVTGTASGILAASVYSPIEQTGTGAEQIFAHGLVTTPVVVLATQTAGHNGAGAAGVNAAVITYGVMSATELRFTVSQGAKFRVLAIK